jgi:hypothetical protein
MLDCLPRLSFDTALLELKAGLFRLTQLDQLLPGVGILVKEPKGGVPAEEVGKKLSKYTKDFYSPGLNQGKKAEDDSKLGTIVSSQALMGLRKAKVGGPHVSMGKALRLEFLDFYDMGEVKATLKQIVAEPTTPKRKDGALAGTLQPPALGFRCTHRPVLC